MGLTRRAPWWLTWLLAGGLVALYLGERVLATAGAARGVASGVGLVVVVLCTVWRLRAWRAAEGEARRVEGLFLLAYACCILALLGHFVSSDPGMRWLGIDFTDDAAHDRYRTILHVLWPLVMALSLFPALAAQIAVGAHRHARAGASRIESFRVAEMATSGLVVALAGGFLFLLGYIVSERDATLDVSYFRTSAPGTTTQRMVSGLDEPLRVLLFFPEMNPVKDEVIRYFRQLDGDGGRVRIEEYDRLAAPEVAEKHSVRSDGTVVLVHGEQSQQLPIGTDLASVRDDLRNLDHRVQGTLYPLLRDRRVVYLTTGHGELNDPESGGPFAGTPLGEVTFLREALTYLNYEVRDLGITSGLAAQVPSDAAIVMVLGPQRPFLEPELAALDRFLADGGAVLLAIDPESDFRLGPLEARLGVRYVHVPLADDQQYVSQRGNLSDRRLIITNRFSSHEAVTTVSNAGEGAGVLLLGPGYLEPIEGSDPAPLFLVRSLPSTFNDADRDYQLDDGTEKRDAYNLIAAVEGDGGDDAGEGDDALEKAAPMRALVFANSAMFSDGVLGSLGLNAALVADGVRWLGGEEEFVGTTESEEDVPIVHTRAEDVAWFYAIILGAPVLVLCLGLTGVYRHRRRKTDS